jgi:hypothetical protein
VKESRRIGVPNPKNLHHLLQNMCGKVADVRKNGMVHAIKCRRFPAVLYSGMVGSSATFSLT